MAMKSARLIGEMLGISASEVNRRLEQAGLIRKASYTVNYSTVDGWELTEEGEVYGKMSNNFPAPIWDESVIGVIQDL